MIYKVDMYYFNKKNETNEGDTWLQGLPYPLTAYKVSSLVQIESPVAACLEGSVPDEGDNPWWSYKLSSNNEVIEGLYCGSEEDVREHLNLVTGNLNKHLFH